jgi:hypothetical protein
MCNNFKDNFDRFSTRTERGNELRNINAPQCLIDNNEELIDVALESMIKSYLKEGKNT